MTRPSPFSSKGRKTTPSKRPSGTAAKTKSPAKAGLGAPSRVAKKFASSAGNSHLNDLL